MDIIIKFHIYVLDNK